MFSVPLPGSTKSDPSAKFSISSEKESEIVEQEPVLLPIDGTLDLHAFAPSDVKELVPDYLEACREKGIFRVRIIHGKGIGQLMRTVHAVLKRLPEVEFFELAGPWEGGSGATIVRLRPDPIPNPTKK
jgi:dsDNA-specific endonuclease/ATPase MutS2